MQKNQLFSKTKHCEICNKVLPPQFGDSICSACKDYAIFQTAKDFIRSGDYNEYDVAQFLNIPLQQVRRWIREGRIQYKEEALNTITLKCHICGSQILFGTICTKCMKVQNVSGSSSLQPAFDAGNMRHLQIANPNGANKKKPV